MANTGLLAISPSDPNVGRLNRIWRTFVERRNPTLKWIFAAAFVLLSLVLSVRGLRNAFSLGGVSFADCLVAFMASVAGVAWFDV